MLGLNAAIINSKAKNTNDESEIPAMSFTRLIFEEKNINKNITATCAAWINELYKYTCPSVSPICNKKVCMIAPEQNIKPILYKMVNICVFLIFVIYILSLLILFQLRKTVL